MKTENETKIVFAKYCPLLINSDPGNLVSVNVDLAASATKEAYCNHTGVPRVEINGKTVAACDGCEEFMQGFVKPLETPVKV